MTVRQLNRTMTEKRERKANFSDGEIRYLLEGILSHKDIIQSKLQNSVTVHHKKEAWARITAAVNACSSGVVRTAKYCQKKFKDLKTAVLKAKADQKKTGGGGPVKQSIYADIILAIIGDSSVVDGIEGVCRVLSLSDYRYSLNPLSHTRFD